MKNVKRVILLVLAIVIGMSVFATTVFAATLPVPESVKEMFKWLFNVLPGEIDTDTGIALFRFMLWILIFSVIYYGASKVFKDNNRIAIVVSIIFALISTLFIPKSIIIFILLYPKNLQYL